VLFRSDPTSPLLVRSKRLTLVLGPTQCADGEPHCPALTPQLHDALQSSRRFQITRREDVERVFSEQKLCRDEFTRACAQLLGRLKSGQGYVLFPTWRTWPGGQADSVATEVVLHLSPPGGSEPLLTLDYHTPSPADLDIIAEALAARLANALPVVTGTARTDESGQFRLVSAPAEWFWSGQPVHFYPAQGAPGAPCATGRITQVTESSIRAETNDNQCGSRPRFVLP